MAGKKIGQLTPLGRNLIATDELELSLAGSAGSRKITGAQIIGAAGGVSSVTGTAPISSTGGATPAISIATASTSTTGALTSTDWNTFNNKQNKLSGENYIFVNSNGTPAQNGQAVRDAYTAAIAMTPNGVAKSATNRVVILLAPGYYTFNEAVDGQFIISSSFIDFESLSGATDVYFSSINVVSTPSIPFQISNIILSGIDTTKNNYYSHGAFAVTSTGLTNENIIVKNCIGGDYSFSSYSIGFAGTYENCTAKTYSFCSTGNGFAPPLGIYGIGGISSFENYGTIKNCSATEYSFCTLTTPISGYVSNYGTIDGCTALRRSFCYCTQTNSAYNNGTIKNCVITSGTGESFCFVQSGTTGNEATNYGKIFNCRSGSSSFCSNSGVWGSSLAALNYGSIIDCSADGNFCFCSSNSLTIGSSVGGNYGNMSNCNAYNGDNCFTGNLGLNGGIISNCISSGRAFCCDAPANITWDIFRCTMVNDTFTVGTTGGGRVVLGIDTTGVVNY